MKPGYQGSDELRSFAEKSMGKAEIRACYAKGGSVKCMAMGGAGKVRKKETKRGSKG